MAERETNKSYVEYFTSVETFGVGGLYSNESVGWPLCFNHPCATESTLSSFSTFGDLCLYSKCLTDRFTITEAEQLVLRLHKGTVQSP